MKKISMGKLQLVSLLDGFIKLDGGAMFGVVPKPIWKSLTPADERNRITLAMRPLLIIHPDANILIDTGIGNKYDEKSADIYGIDRHPGIEDELKKAGLTPDKIDIVINTHLHFDHAGGNTTKKGNKIFPTFPNAKYIIQSAEWDVAIHPNPRSKASYLPENFIPIKENGNLEIIKGEKEILPGIRCVLTNGHTEGHQIVIIGSENKGALYWGDLIPTIAHIRTPYIMGYDIFPLNVMRGKEKYIKFVEEKDYISFFEHDPLICCGYIRGEGKKIHIEPYKGEVRSRK